MKPVIISALILACIAFGAALVPVCEKLDRVFSPPDRSVGDTHHLPAYHSIDFSSPSSGTGTAQAVPVLFNDPNDILYWPSIKELQWFAQTDMDGLFRRKSQDDYEARRFVWYCNLNAQLLWPKEAK